MSKGSVFEQGWIDLVFEGRNKAYGAYKLRQQESKTTILALISGILLILALVSIPVIANHFAENTDVTNTPTGPIIIETKPLPKFPEPEEPVVHKPEPKKAAATPAPKPPEPTVRFKKFQASNNPNPVLPSTPDVIDKKPGNSNNQGDGSGNFSTGATSGTGTEDGTGTGNSDGTDPNGAVSTAILDEMPSFPGGLEKFYEKVIRDFETPDLDDATTLRVYVSFVVEKDGSITNVTILKDPGYGAGKEAIRVLNAIKTKWNPGKMKGKPVRTAYNLPITINIK